MLILVGALAALLGASAGFALGRWKGAGLLLRIGDRLRQSPERVQRLRRQVANAGGLWLFVGRFIPGLRNVVGLLAGASGMRAGRFLAITAAGAIVWAATSALEYYWFGRTLIGADTWLQVVLVCVGLASMVAWMTFLRRRVMRRVSWSGNDAS